MPDELNFNVPIRLNSFGETIRRIEAERLEEAKQAPRQETTMIPALAIICCVITALAIATVLLAYACARVSTRAYPTKPGTCTHENKDLT